jgi:hypothetical protein
MTSDAVLAHDGLAPNGHGRVLLIACGALAREIIALRKGHGWDHLDLQCLPAIYHNRPEKITPAVREIVTQNRDHYDRMFVVYADCGTGGSLQAACDEMGVSMIAGPHCYSFYEGNDRFAELGEVTSFFLTDFLVRQFDPLDWEPLGLAKHPQLRDMYFGNYEKLVYQAQIEDPELIEKARECADRLGLAFEYRFTGYGDLAAAIGSA